MKNFIKWSLLGSSVFLLAACSNGDDKTSDSGKKDNSELVAWAWDPTYNIKALEEADKVYEPDKENLKIVSSSQEDVVQKLNTALSANNKDGLPSIVLIEDYRAQGFLKSYPDAFEDLSDIVKKDDFAEYKFPSISNDGKVYGIPFDSGVTGMYYRSDLLKEAGYEEDALKDITWDDYIKIAKDVKEETGKAMLTVDPSDLGLVRVMMQSAGSWYTDKDGKVDIENNDALKAGLKVFASLIKDGISEPVAGWDAGVEAVNTGKVASTVTGSWYSSSIKQAEDQTGKWHIAPTPKLSDIKGSANASNLGGSSWYVLKGVGDTEKAKAFMKDTFASSKPLMETLTKEIGLVSTLKAAKETPIYQEPVEFYGDQKVYADFSTWMNDVPAVNYGQDTYAIETVMSEYAQQIINGDDIDKVLKDAQKQVEASVKQ